MYEIIKVTQFPSHSLCSICSLFYPEQQKQKHAVVVAGVAVVVVAYCFGMPRDKAGWCSGHAPLLSHTPSHLTAFIWLLCVLVLCECLLGLLKKRSERTLGFLPSSSSHQCQCKWLVRMLTGLILCSHSCYKFMNAAILSYLEETISIWSSLASGSYSLPSSPSVMVHDFGCFFFGGGVILMDHFVAELPTVT